MYFGENNFIFSENSNSQVFPCVDINAEIIMFASITKFMLFP